MNLSADKNGLCVAATVVAIATSALAVGCSRKVAEPAKPSATAVAAAKPKTVEIWDEPGARTDPLDAKHGSRKLLNLDAPVYVDGVQVAVLRYGDLAVAPQEVLEGGTPSFALYDYLTSIGVAADKVKSVHIHSNGDRIGSVEGDELRKEPKRFVFTFSSSTTGAPIQRWDTGGLKNQFVAHELRRVSVFVKKAPAPIHPQKRCHLDAKGECTDAIPYAESDPVKGTRVYVDGKMVGFVKRRLLSDATILGKTEDGDVKYSVARLVKGFGVDVDGAKAVELVAGDDVVARAAAQDWGKVEGELFFTLPKHQHGKVRVHVPASIQANEGSKQDRDALVSSVVVYKTTTPAQRDLSPISEDTDLSVQLASASEDADGSKER